MLAPLLLLASTPPTSPGAPRASLLVVSEPLWGREQLTAEDMAAVGLGAGTARSLHRASGAGCSDSRATWASPRLQL